MSFLKIIASNRRSLAILIDPEKVRKDQIVSCLKHCEWYVAKVAQQLHLDTHIYFVGGSSHDEFEIDDWVLELKSQTDKMVVLFPGSHKQLSAHADAVLLLQLVSGRNPKYLIEEHVLAAPFLHKSIIEKVPTGYLLIDGGVRTSVMQVSQTTPISQDDTLQIVNTALASQYLGHQLIYLEAGSGALTPVAPSIVKEVAKTIEVPVIVGGGLRELHQIKLAYESGASMVVIGTFVEDLYL